MAKNKGFLGLVGFITVGGGPRFFVFLDAADRGAMGGLYYHAKVSSFRDSIKRRCKKE
jgi:hypothetical protein